MAGFITNYAARAHDPRAATALDLIEAGIAAAHPARLVPGAVRVQDGMLIAGDAVLPLPPNGFLVVGGGKAAGAMAAAFEQTVGVERVRAGVVATAAGDWPTRRVRQVVAGHPTPTVAGRMAVQEMVRLTRGATGDDLVVCLLSGGGSSMLTYPPPGARLRDMVRLTRLLLASGAAIADINVVRRRLSRTAGGKLARLLAPARVVTLALRDVVSGPPEAIASGPTLPDPTTFADALAVLDRYGLRDRIPRALRRLLEQGLAGQHPENPKPGDPLFDRCTFVELGDTRTALAGMTAAAQRKGLAVQVLGHDQGGEAREAARRFGAMFRRAAARAPAGGLALVWGGEFTVTLGRTRGAGGRCQEFLAALIPEIAGLPCAVALAGTDGSDFLPGVGGAVITGATAAAVAARGLDLDAALGRHDTAPLHRALGTLLDMRPTGTNVCDVGVCVLGG